MTRHIKKCLHAITVLVSLCQPERHRNCLLLAQSTAGSAGECEQTETETETESEGRECFGWIPNCDACNLSSAIGQLFRAVSAAKILLSHRFTVGLQLVYSKLYG